MCPPQSLSLARILSHRHRPYPQDRHHTATHCNTLQHTATHCNTLQHNATHGNALSSRLNILNTLQHAVTCNFQITYPPSHTASHLQVRLSFPTTQNCRTAGRNIKVCAFLQTVQNLCLTQIVRTTLKNTESDIGAARKSMSASSLRRAYAEEKASTNLSYSSTNSSYAQLASLRTH